MKKLISYVIVFTMMLSLMPSIAFAASSQITEGNFVATVKDGKATITKYKGKTLEKHMELLYKDLDKKLLEIEISSEYKSAELKLNEFIEKNQLMEESTLYYLTKGEEENAKKLEEISDDDLFDDLEDSIEYIDVPEESFVIDTVIQRLENRYQNDYNVFLEHKQLFENLLENEEYILFCCIWDEPENMSIEKEINIKDLKIEDLASLEYNQILKINK